MQSVLLRRRRTPSEDRELRFATREFSAANDVVKTLSGPGRLRALCSPAWDRKLLSSGLAVMRLPVTELVMRQSAAGDWSSDLYPPAGRRVGGSRWAQSVLELDGDESRYLAGKSKQALRTNLRHARTAGIVCTKVDFDEFDKAARQILDGRSQGRGAHSMCEPLDNQEVGYYVASTLDGTPCVFAGVAVFGNFGLLFVMLTDTELAEAKMARYLLHTAIVADQAKSAASYLLAGPVLSESPGNQYFQHLLGYRARNLRFTMVQG